MNGLSLQRLVRHGYSDGTYSYHYAPVGVKDDDAAVNLDDATPSANPADLFTDWPPQPMTAWLDGPQPHPASHQNPLLPAVISPELN